MALTKRKPLTGTKSRPSLRQEGRSSRDSQKARHDKVRKHHAKESLSGKVGYDYVKTTSDFASCDGSKPKKAGRAEKAFDFHNPSEAPKPPEKVRSKAHDSGICATEPPAPRSILASEGSTKQSVDRRKTASPKNAPATPTASRFEPSAGRTSPKPATKRPSGEASAPRLANERGERPATHAPEMPTPAAVAAAAVDAVSRGRLAMDPGRMFRAQNVDAALQKRRPCCFGPNRKQASDLFDPRNRFSVVDWDQEREDGDTAGGTRTGMGAGFGRRGSLRLRENFQRDRFGIEGSGADRLTPPIFRRGTVGSGAEDRARVGERTSSSNLFTSLDLFPKLGKDDGLAPLPILKYYNDVDRNRYPRAKPDPGREGRSGAGRRHKRSLSRDQIRHPPSDPMSLVLEGTSFLPPSPLPHPSMMTMMMTNPYDSGYLEFLAEQQDQDPGCFSEHATGAYYGGNDNDDVRTAATAVAMMMAAAARCGDVRGAPNFETSLAPADPYADARVPFDRLERGFEGALGPAELPPQYCDRMYPVAAPVGREESSDFGGAIAFQDPFSLGGGCGGRGGSNGGGNGVQPSPQQLTQSFSRFSEVESCPQPERKSSSRANPELRPCLKRSLPRSEGGGAREGAGGASGGVQILRLDDTRAPAEEEPRAAKSYAKPATRESHGSLRRNVSMCDRACSPSSDEQSAVAAEAVDKNTCTSATSTSATSVFCRCCCRCCCHSQRGEPESFAPCRFRSREEERRQLVDRSNSAASFPIEAAGNNNNDINKKRETEQDREREAERDGEREKERPLPPVDKQVQAYDIKAPQTNTNNRCCPRAGQFAQESPSPDDRPASPGYCDSDGQGSLPPEKNVVDVLEQINEVIMSAFNLYQNVSRPVGMSMGGPGAGDFQGMQGQMHQQFALPAPEPNYPPTAGQDPCRPQSPDYGQLSSPDYSQPSNSDYGQPPSPDYSQACVQPVAQSYCQPPATQFQGRRNSNAVFQLPDKVSQTIDSQSIWKRVENMCQSLASPDQLQSSSQENRGCQTPNQENRSCQEEPNKLKKALVNLCNVVQNPDAISEIRYIFY